MQSPTIVGTPTETAISTASTSHVVNLPSGAAGNMFLAIMSKGSAGTTPSVNALAGWQELLDEAIVLGLFAAVKVCDGTEGATTTFTLSSATRGAWIVYEINGQAATATQLPEIGTTATGSSTTPDPPTRTVNGGTKTVLTIPFFGRAGEEADDDTWVTAAPSGYGSLLQKACGVAGTNLAGMVASAHLAESTSSTNPGTFTCATGAWRANTIVIHPAPQEFQLSVPFDLGLGIVTALARETFLSVPNDLGLGIVTALVRETFLSAAAPFGPVIDTNLLRELPLTVPFDLGLSIVTNLDVETPSGVEHFISADMSLGLVIDTALVRETFIAAATDLNAQIVTALTRETFISADMALNIQIATALLRETFLSAALALGPDVATALLRETFIGIPDDLGLLITTNLTMSTPGSGGGTHTNRTLLGAG